MRFQARVELMRLALDRGYNEETVGALLRLLEWIMSLPKVLEKRYEELLEAVKRERQTTFLASFERRALLEGLQQGWEQGLQQGLQQGLLEGLIALLNDLYGTVPETLTHQLEQVTDRETLRTLYAEAVRAGSLEAFQQRVSAIMANQAGSDGVAPTSAD
ncbi:MAG: hypothetical protein NZL85_07110 [Fimbriimonadales bacterium]|nr:hypothetical protein [Fimbriimonadales bacterium]